MLKTCFYPTHFSALPSRSPKPAKSLLRQFALIQRANMSADATVSKTAQREMEQQERIQQDPRAQRGAPAFFPIGYKEAAYQWVCTQPPVTIASS